LKRGWRIRANSYGDGREFFMDFEEDTDIESLIDITERYTLESRDDEDDDEDRKHNEESSVDEETEGDADDADKFDDHDEKGAE